jgi:hypothetical protein
MIIYEKGCKHSVARRWSQKMQMLAQVLKWENSLASSMLPVRVRPKSLQAILSSPVNSVVETGHSLASERPSGERLLPLLDMIECMHGPNVLPVMKKAFKEDAMSHLKEKFHDLLGALYTSAKHCVESFSVSIAAGAVRKESTASLTLVTQQTALAMRILKVSSTTGSHTLVRTAA